MATFSIRRLTIVVLFQFCIILVGADDTNERFIVADSASSVGEKECHSNNDGTCTNHNDNASASSGTECGVWLAMSSLPGTGIGMFAGQSFHTRDELTPDLGDHCVPIVDINLYHQDLNFLWDEYTWNAKYLRANNLGRNDVNVASPGFGAAANSFMDFLNVDEGMPTHSVAQGLHRSKDPGAGAFTPYHSRKATARRDIEAGQEIFVSYGNTWFTGRQYLGPIPIMGDHKRADALLTWYMALKTAISKPDLLEEAWDTFVLNSTWPSRVIAALPEKEDYEKVPESGGLLEFKRNTMVRSQEWLEKHGVCSDHFYLQESTIPQAGNGAFARRFLKKGSAVLPVPMIHVPDRKVFKMYEIQHRREGGTHGSRAANHNNVTGHQLLLNYCLGHNDSTLLLCPYGPGFGLINHNKTQVNVRLQWASTERSNHHPELLEKNITELAAVESSQLAMELIALRDIHPGEEIFLDYGDEWEEAWEKHVKNWKPVAGSENYVSALEMEAKSEPLRTEFEQMKQPYPSNLSLKFDRAFESSAGHWRSLMEVGKDLVKYREKKEKDLDKCEIMRYRRDGERILYTAVIPEAFESKKSILVEDVPREAFIFVDRPHTADMFLPNAFRHDIRIPDDLFPESWKNSRDIKTTDV